MKKILLLVPVLFCSAHSMQPNVAFTSGVETTFRPLASDSIVVKDGQFFQLNKRVSSATGTPVVEVPVALPIYTSATDKALIKAIEEQEKRTEEQGRLIENLYRSIPLFAFPLLSAQPKGSVPPSSNWQHNGFLRDGWLCVDIKRNSEKEDKDCFGSLLYGNPPAIEVLSVKGASLKTFIPLSARTPFSWKGCKMSCAASFYESGNAVVLDDLKVGKTLSQQLEETKDEFTPE